MSTRPQKGMNPRWLCFIDINAFYSWGQELLAYKWLKFITTWIRLPNRSWFISYKHGMQDTGSTHLCLNHVQKQHPWSIITFLLLVTADFKGWQLVSESKYMLLLKKTPNLILGAVHNLFTHTCFTFRQFSVHMSGKWINQIYLFKCLNWKHIEQLSLTSVASFYEFASKHSWDILMLPTWRKRE